VPRFKMTIMTLAKSLHGFILSSGRMIFYLGEDSRAGEKVPDH
jgi:hypothetical protein